MGSKFRHNVEVKSNFSRFWLLDVTYLRKVIFVVSSVGRSTREDIENTIEKKIASINKGIYFPLNKLTLHRLNGEMRKARTIPEKSWLLQKENKGGRKTRQNRKENANACFKCPSEKKHSVYLYVLLYE